MARFKQRFTQHASLNTPIETSMRTILLISAIATALAPHLLAADPAITELSEVDAQYAYIGEYTAQTGDGPVGVRISTQAGDQPLFAKIYKGGLPGLGWKTDKPELATGSLDSQGVTLRGTNGSPRQVRSSGNRMVLVEPSGQEIELKKIARHGITLGKAAPAGAKVLFNGSDTSAWKNAKVTDDGLLRMGCETVDPLVGGHLHVEFRTPYMPTSVGQKRGNSGIYLQKRYEVQVLESFALEGIENECGAIYRQRRPDLNMALPPLVWQSYDIFLTPAVFQDDKKVKGTELTVIHNGVPVHYRTLVVAKTGAGSPEGPDPLPLLLQDHGDPVVYRNIWHVPTNALPIAQQHDKLKSMLTSSTGPRLFQAPRSPQAAE